MARISLLDSQRDCRTDIVHGCFMAFPILTSGLYLQLWDLCVEHLERYLEGLGVLLGMCWDHAFDETFSVLATKVLELCLELSAGPV